MGIRNHLTRIAMAVADELITPHGDSEREPFMRTYTDKDLITPHGDSELASICATSTPEAFS